ncbi:amino acid oxidase [Candidatus Roizmanbacteria bacterium CG_4_9_14_3_um_filter_36_11]|nr:MAG: amino acid oxidase [Candidatus Roizmanbacteria bacterium CG_4_9_14_3_um_filter_36_11]
MSNFSRDYDCVIIGGGIFGLYAASFLSAKGTKVAILEKEKTIFERASKINQARVHRGYHYPRSFATAQKVANYYHRFCNDFHFSLLKPFKQYYAVSKKNSKISAADYIRFCRKINIPLKEIDPCLYFNKNKVSAAFEVEESCFNYLKIKEYFLKKFTNNNKVDIYYKTFPASYKIINSHYILSLNNTLVKLKTPFVINATYSNINEINKMFGFDNYKIKYELCELALGRVSNGFSRMGLTVIDGPLFSLMPFTDGNVCSLSSVRFTPISTSYLKPQNIECRRRSNWRKMESLAGNYLKHDFRFRYKSSIIDIKPILLASEKDDSRPTLITCHSKNPFFISVLAGKISTIYDLEEKLNEII